MPELIHAQEAALHQNVTQTARTLGKVVPIFSLAFISYILRMYTRTRGSSVLRWDDYTITIAMAIALGDFVLQMVMLGLGGGRHFEYIAPENIPDILEIQFLLATPWAWSLTLSKLTLTIMLWRIQKYSAAWRWTLSIVTAITIATAIITTVFQYTVCDPLSLIWMRGLGSGCRSTTQANSMIICTTALFVLTDLFFSFAPMTFIYSMNRPIFEKIVISILMALGIMTAIASGLKLRYLKSWAEIKDPVWETVDFYVWGAVETYMAILAACVPTLKSLVEGRLRKFSNRKSKYNSAKENAKVSSSFSKQSNQTSTEDSPESL